MNTAEARKNMALGQLITNEVMDPRILEAMMEVPREAFVPEALGTAAYADEDLHVGAGRYLMAPLTFCKLLSYAQITPESQVLVVGALTGYTAAVVAKLGGHVVAIENNESMVAVMREGLAYLGITNADAHVVRAFADGYEPASPYDAIIMCGGVSNIPKTLTDQLAIGGRLVAVRLSARRVDIRGGMGRGVVAKRFQNQCHVSEHFDASTVLLPGF